MPLSTSNSNERIPEALWGSIWLKVILIVLPIVIVWNINWVRQEVYPAPRDTSQFWWEHRDRLKPNDSNAIVLLGSSRMLAGIDQSVFTEMLGIAPVQLAINDQSAYFTLGHFADDPTFKGTIIAEVTVPLLFGAFQYQPVSKDRGDCAESIYKSQYYSSNLQKVKSYLIATPNIGADLPEMLLNTFSANAVKKFPNMMSDRSTPYYREHISDRRNKKVLDRNIFAVLNPDPVHPGRYEYFLKRIQTMEEHIRRIRARGGKVILVDFPSSGKLKVVTEEKFPRKQYWDVLAKKTSAKTIHYEDYLSLSKFKCVDGSHLAAENTQEFTQNLIKIIFDSNH